MTQSQDRIAALLGPLRGVLTPIGTLLTCLIGWAICAPFSSSLAGMAWCWWGVGCLLAAIQLERPWLQVLPFPPVTVLMIHLSLRWVLGGMLLLMSRSGAEDVQIWIDHVAEALPLNAVMTTTIVLVGAIWNRQIILARSPMHPAGVHSGRLVTGEGVSRQQLLYLAVITGVVAVGYTFVGFFSGTLDRGAAYLDWAGKLWKPDTLFAAIIKLRDLYFLILPWLLWEWRSNRFVILIFGALTTASLALSFSLGGRGLILYPALLLVAGLWLARAPLSLLRWLVSGLVITSLVITILLPITRNQPGFQQSGAWNLQARFEALKTSLPELTQTNSMALLGRDLYAWSDPYLFREPALSQKQAGTKRLNGLIYLWVPKLLKPDKPELNDGHLIAKEIIGAPTAGMHEGRHIWFPGVSLAADLFWRFRWPGVIVGSLAFAVIFNGLAKVWYQFADLKRNSTQLLIALYPSTFLQGPPLRSVSETIWSLGYELPKYILIMGFLAFTLQFFKKKKLRQEPFQGSS